ncbi:luciferase-like monooxygenase [Lophiotrema nucula]|uniref:Luciferase-like monooxygenase n=1 Tax=Lophiotrema nucula TaxID=690887 RepID=A0A6A5ZEP7_9PLEO|nr:luciferase-like monooxygenase [Lophiotrema nucula]
MATTSVRSGGPPLISPLDDPTSPLSRAISKQPILLGVFLNLQDIHVSSHPTSNSWDFPYNLACVQEADRQGFELAFSRMQWLPKGGYDGSASLDAFIALGAMATATKDIHLISTLHVLYGPLHPLHLAKWGATLDHISQGRWGLNIVTGHRVIEHEMFGAPPGGRIEHDQRYARAGELLDVVYSLWAEDENLSYDAEKAGKGNTWKLNDAWVTPKPLHGRPVVVNATGSPAGIEFASSYSDIIFITSPGGAHIDSALETLPDHIKTIKEIARQKGKNIMTLINPIVVSRDTSEEADAYAQAIWEGKPRQEGSKIFGANKHYDSDAHAWKGRQDKSHKQGLNIGGNIEIIGSPEQVVDQIEALHKIGIDGIQLCFYDFLPDLEHFGRTILPLLKERGLRV